MTTVALVLLLLGAAVPMALPLLEPRVRTRIDPVLVVAALAVALLAVAAVIATSANAASGWERIAAPALAVAVATSGGSPVVRAVFRLMRREFVPAARATAPAVDDVPEAPPETVLRGGAWIGYLERAAAAVSVLAGFPEGLAIVLGVKGVGRYSELRETNAPEAFIIGTMASMLWAVAAAGTGHLLG